MEEIEVKILGIDKDSIEQKLVSMGAEKTFDAEINAFYYDFPDMLLKRHGAVLRLRLEGNNPVITYKGSVGHVCGIGKELENCVKKYPSRAEGKVKVLNELETSLENFDAMRKILEGIGMVCWFKMRKRRISYALEEAHFELDKYLGEYDFVPWFLEIECSDSEALFSYAEQLGFKREDCKPWSFPEVVEYYS